MINSCPTSPWPHPANVLRRSHRRVILLNRFTRLVDAPRRTSEVTLPLLGIQPRLPRAFVSTLIAAILIAGAAVGGPASSAVAADDAGHAPTSLTVNGI